MRKPPDNESRGPGGPPTSTSSLTSTLDQKDPQQDTQVSRDGWCRFTSGSLYCVNDPCPNPNHRTPDPGTRGIVPPPPPPARQPVRFTSRPRRLPHCGHGFLVEHQGDKSPDCLYCAEGIDPDDFWDMVRFVNAIHREQRRPRKPRAEKRDKHQRREYTMRPCDVCGRSLLLNRDRECALTPRCPGWHTLTSKATTP